MYIENIKDEFYEFLSGKRILLMVHYDIDSICALKIFQNLLRFNHILYTISVIRGVNDLKQSYQENCQDVKYFILINCGGTVDLIDELEPAEDTIFFVLDSHRPTDLANIFSNSQIRLLTRPEDDRNVPSFNDIFREESDEEMSDDEEEGDGEESAAKRRRLGEEEIMKRRERRLWEENRNKLFFEYSQFTYYIRASSIVMFNLAWKLNQDDKELLWLTIVALTEQYITGKISDATYVLETGNLHSHMNRLNNRSNSDAEVATTIRVSFLKDLKLILYRHWSVEDSLKYSQIPAVTLKLWSHRGAIKLQSLLADMGFPLVQSQQCFQSMDLQLRKEFHESLEKMAEKYELQDLIFTTFLLQYGYRNKYCATDFVHCLIAILESSPRDKSPQECFNLALDFLARSKKEVIDGAVERAKIVAKTIFKTVKAAVDMKQIITAGPFIYFIIQEGCLDWSMFSHHQILLLLAQFILKAYVSISRNRRAKKLPLIVSAPRNLEQGTCILVGIPPYDENSSENFFGKAFEKAAETINCDATYDFFDTSYFEIYTKDRTRFFDALTAILT